MPTPNQTPFMKRTVCLPILILGTLCGASYAQDRVDGWYELDYLTAAAPSAENLVTGRKSKAFHYDISDKKAGDFSILYTHAKAPKSSKIGFVSYPFPVWELAPSVSLHMWLKIEANDWDSDVRFRITIRDSKGKSARYNLDKANFRTGEWVELDIPFAQMDDIKSVDLKQLSEVYLDTRMPKDAVVRFDDVYFHVPSKPGSAFGVTDKTVRQRMLEARISRNMRAYETYTSLAKKEKPPVLSALFAKFWLGKDLGYLNKQLVTKLTKERTVLDESYGFGDTWHLFATPWLIRMYETFGPGEGQTNGRLSKEAEAAILQVLWERTFEKNDIHWARARNPWMMDGSENHDINMVVANYLSSQIFVKLPEYNSRHFANKGKGGGAAYWFHTDRGDVRFHGPYGEANLSDGKTYVAKDHYEAWGDHLKAVFRERAGKGFFLEQASPTYMKYTLGFLQDVYEFTDDPEMKELSRSFLDLVWTTWASETLHGLRGGAKTRDHLYTQVQSDSMYNMSKFIFGGILTGGNGYYQLPAMDYEFPEIVWQLALDRDGLGEFASVSRAIGEEPGKLPRDPGLERTMDLDTEHRMVRYAWVTPEYILGAQMDHPLAIHSHLSPTSRNFGVLYGTHPNARVFPYGVKKSGSDWELVKRAGIMSRTVQHENVLISQQARGFIQVNPEWYPQRSLRPEEFGVYISPEVDRVEERDGWVFIEEGDAFTAIRIVAGVYTANDRPENSTRFVKYKAKESINEPLATDTYEWSADRSILVSKDPFYPIIWDCSSRSHFPSLEAFMGAVLKNRLELVKTVVPGWHKVVYQGTGDNAATLHMNLANNEIPTINGEPVDYSPVKMWNSPYIQSEYGSGKIRAGKGESGTLFDFSNSGD